MTSSLVEVTGRARIAVVTAVLLVILGVTLAPSGNAPPDPFSICIACGPRGLADGILNVCLFVPLGLALGWNSPRTSAVIFFGFVLSATIELAQSKIPGRDPSLSDITFNTLGTALGAVVARQSEAWLHADQRSASILASWSLVFVTTIMLATAFLLSPADSSSYAGRSGNDVVLRYTTWASRVALDEPAYIAAGAAVSPLWGPGSVSLSRDRARWRIRVGAHDIAIVGPTVGQGWTLLAYPDAIARRWGRLVDALWMVGLFVPIGFWARGRMLAIAAAIAAFLLAVIPVVTGVVRTSTEEWTGAAIGLLVGATIQFLWSRSAVRVASMRPE